MTIRAKAVAALLIIIVLTVGSAALTLYIQSQDDAPVKTAARTARTLQLHTDLKATMVEIRSNRRLYLLTGGPGLQRRVLDGEKQATILLERLDAEIVDATQRQTLNQMRAEFARWRQLTYVPPLEGPGPDAVERVLRTSDVAFAPLRDLLDSFDGRQRDLAATAQQRIEQYRAVAQTVVLGIELAALGIVALLIVTLNRNVFQPLSALTRTAAAITQGNVTHVHPVERSDEVGMLTNALSRMLTTINDREDQLRLKHQELQITLETLPAAFLLVDRFGQARMQNTAATGLIGAAPTGRNAMEQYRAELKLMTRDGKAIPPDRWPLARALRGEIVKGEDVEVHTKNGSVPMLVAAAPIRDVNGAIDGALVAFQDVSTLRAVDRMKDEFVSIVSHELRTPLTSIRGSLQLVLDDVDGAIDSEHRQLLNVGLNNCERLIRIINDILDVSKIEAGRMKLQTAPANVAELVRLALDSVESIASAARVTFDVQIPSVLPAVVVDQDRIVQALVNLISNAVKFAPNDSVVKVEVTHAHGEIAIAVRDSGAGISTDDLARLFQKFQQVDASASRRKGGTGLGLVISKALVEQHGGRIEVESSVGNGARFTIVLPAGPSPAPEAVRSIRGDVGTQVRSAAGTILIIDDDDEFRMVVRRQLEKSGYRVVEARDGAAGLHVARETRPDAITLDLMMPGMNGWEVLAKLTADPDLNTIPVIVISATADQPGPLAREVAVLAKPVGQDQLLHEIAQVLTTPGATVLVAEDDEDLRRVLSEALQRRGYRVVHARDGAEALAIFESTQIDLLVLDLKMPNVDGLAVIKRLRDSVAGRAVPIVVVSGSDGEGRSEFRAMRLGADVYMTKPIEAGNLAQEIQKLIPRSA